MNTILVAQSTPIKTGSGYDIQAIRPLKKGEKISWALSNGKLLQIKGARFNGVGIARFFAEAGYVEAESGHKDAERLAELVSIRDGLDLVEHAGQEEAARQQEAFGGKACFFVPFDPNAAIEPIRVREPSGFRTTVLELGAGFSSAAVQGDYAPQDGFSCTEVKLSSGWLVGPDGDPAALPRSTEYGGLVEMAVFVIANSGLGTLQGNPNLAFDPSAESGTFCRGRLTLALTGKTDDVLVIGIDGCDELVVQYRRAGEVIFQREGLEDMNSRLNLGAAIGSIAAALVRVAEMDAVAATSAPRTRRKKAA